MLRHDYLNARMLKGISAYKYKASGYTWMDDLHNPVWNWLVENLCPMWLAPNLITLTGLMFVIASHVALAVYAPELDGGRAPAWVHWFAGVSLITYVNLDCMDGKQARRTQTSSPLGQLFDHGCDALSVGLIIVNVATSANLQLSPQMVLMMAGPLGVWILAQWEEYHTGIMQYGNGYFGILEANYALAAVHLISAVLGPDIWKAKLDTITDHMPEMFLQWSVIDIIFTIAITCMMVQMVGQITNVYKSMHNMDAKEQGHKELGAVPATKHLLFMVLLFVLSYLFLMQPPHGGVYHTRALLMCVLICYTTIATQLIMAHMAKEALEPAKAPYVFLALGVINSLFDFVEGETLTYGMAVIVILLYLHYVMNVCRQVCHHLGINCLTIRKCKM